MNDEIREILDKMFLNCDTQEEKNKVLDYITNLQQENQNLSRMCELYGKSLYNAELTDYKSRIEKAVEYIKHEWFVEGQQRNNYKFDNDVIDILNGKE